MRGRKGRKGAEKRGGRGVASKGGKKEKGRAKTGQVRIHFSHPESDGKLSDVGVVGQIGILSL